MDPPFRTPSSAHSPDRAPGTLTRLLEFVAARLDPAAVGALSRTVALSPQPDAPLSRRPSPERAHSESEAAWRRELLGLLGLMTSDAFERLCQHLLREAGFTKVEVTGRTGDGGIDGTGVLRLNLLSFHVFFQCKRWKGSVGSSVVRDFRGAMVGRADKGLILTTGVFTAEARREATRDGAPPVDLVDGEGLCDLMKDHGLGVRVRMVEEILVDGAAFRELITPHYG